MLFRTEFSIPPSNKKISHKDTIFLMGSCFSQHIGQKLTEAGFHAWINPFGTVYNPVSISRQLSMLLQQQTVDVNQFVFSQELYVHPDFHSSVGKSSADETSENIQQITCDMHEKICTTDWLILTLGTAMAYVWHKTGEVVANCHKLPATEFTKTRVAIDDMFIALNQVITRLRTSNPKMKVVVTVSPVRHTREGMPENARSKARLLEVAHLLTEAASDVFYFPSYEWMMDDLRDYRFYGTDMIHPSEQAVDYLWHHFQQCFMDTPTQQIAKRASEIRQSANHRPIHPQTASFRQFCQTQMKKITDLEAICPEIKLQGPREHFASFL